MSFRAKIAALGLLGLAAVAVVAFAYARQAMREVRPFYARAIQMAPQELASASRRMESRVSALYSDAQPPGEWKTVFSDAEVNGWLAVALQEKYADLLPPEVSDPRVAFADGRCLVGFRYHSDRIDAVVSVEAEAFMADDDVAAIRLLDARAGSLPVPMSQVVESISDAAQELNLAVRWTQLEEDPVLLVSIANALSTGDELRQLKLLELRDGELLLAGTTEKRPAPKAARTTQTGG
jgi:hypothetical protein